MKATVISHDTFESVPAGIERANVASALLVSGGDVKQVSYATFKGKTDAVKAALAHAIAYDTATDDEGETGEGLIVRLGFNRAATPDEVETLAHQLTGKKVAAIVGGSGGAWWAETWALSRKDASTAERTLTAAVEHAGLRVRKSETTFSRAIQFPTTEVK